jgi:hypothetical protein
MFQRTRRFSQDVARAGKFWLSTFAVPGRYGHKIQNIDTGATVVELGHHTFLPHNIRSTVSMARLSVFLNLTHGILNDHIMRSQKKQQHQPEPLQPRPARHRYLMETSFSASTRERETFDSNTSSMNWDDNVDSSPLLIRVVKPSSHNLYTVMESFSEDAEENI